MGLNKKQRYLFRKERTRKKIFGTENRPRLAVHCSLKHVYAQLINDELSKTLVFVSTQSPELKEKLKSTGNISAAKTVGELLAKKALDAGIKKVQFDRGGKIYHGKIKALADTARQTGLEF